MASPGLVIRLHGQYQSRDRHRERQPDANPRTRLLAFVIVARVRFHIRVVTVGGGGINERSSEAVGNQLQRVVYLWCVRAFEVVPGRRVSDELRSDEFGAKELCQIDLGNF